MTDGAIKIERAWADVDTKELQEWIDMFTAEVLRRAFAGEDEAIETFALKIGGLVSRLQDLTHRQRERVQQVAARAVFWPVNVTQRDIDFSSAKKHVGDLKVGSKSLLPAKTRSRIARFGHLLPGKTRDRHGHFARLAERLWLQLLTNRHELRDLIKRAGSGNARKLKTKWVSLCLSLPAVRTSQEISLQDALEWWKLGEALLLEAWEQDRQSAFGSVLPQYAGKDQTGKDKYTEAETKRDIFKRFKSAFLKLVKSGMTSTE